MCEPISAGTALALSAAATAAGTGLTMMQNNAAADAQNRANSEAAAVSARARTAERARQDEYSREAFDRWQSQVQQTGPDAAQGEQRTLADAILDTQQDVASTVDTTGLLPGQDRAEAPTREAIAGQVARAAQDARRRVQGMATAAGYDAVPAMFGTANQRFGADMGLMANRSRASLALGQGEGAVPQGQVTGGGTDLGAILSGAGQMGTRYAASRGAFG